MAGPATDIVFDAASRRLRALAASMEMDTQCWPAMDPALYGLSNAKASSVDVLASSQSVVRAAVASLRTDADACDSYAAGCRAHYDAYRQYRAAQSVYNTAWANYRSAVAQPTSPDAPTLQPPSLIAPFEPPCPPYCDPTPVR